MALSVLALLAGLAALVWGGSLFVAASVRLAELLRLPRIVIGSTIVSLATTSPELVVAVTAALEGEPALAVGNAVGSCVCNIGLVLGTMALLRHVEVDTTVLRIPLLAMGTLGVVLLAMTADLHLSRPEGLLLVAAGIGYVVWDVRRHLRARRRAEAAEARRIERDLVAGRPWLATPLGTATQFAGGAACVALGSRWLVDGAVAVATALAVPTMVIGVSVVAVGTSLPELVTAVSSSRRNVSDLAVGNVLGANIANLGLIAGTASAIDEATMSRVSQLLHFPAVLLATALFVGAVLRGRRVTRAEGGVLLAFYALYLAAVVATSAADLERT
jgi:cation:H+ antiporter